MKKFIVISSVLITVIVIVLFLLINCFAFTTNCRVCDTEGHGIGNVDIDVNDGKDTWHVGPDGVFYPRLPDLKDVKDLGQNLNMLRAYDLHIKSRDSDHLFYKQTGQTRFSVFQFLSPVRLLVMRSDSVAASEKDWTYLGYLEKDKNYKIEVTNPPDRMWRLNPNPESRCGPEGFDKGNSCIPPGMAPTIQTGNVGALMLKWDGETCPYKKDLVCHSPFGSPIFGICNDSAKSFAMQNGLPCDGQQGRPYILQETGGYEENDGEMHIRITQIPK